MKNFPLTDQDFFNREDKAYQQFKLFTQKARKEIVKLRKKRKSLKEKDLMDLIKKFNLPDSWFYSLYIYIMTDRPKQKSGLHEIYPGFIVAPDQSCGNVRKKMSYNLEKWIALLYEEFKNADNKRRKELTKKFLYVFEYSPKKIPRFIRGRWRKVNIDFHPNNTLELGEIFKLRPNLDVALEARLNATDEDGLDIGQKTMDRVRQIVSRLKRKSSL